MWGWWFLFHFSYKIATNNLANASSHRGNPHAPFNLWSPAFCPSLKVTMVISMPLWSFATKTVVAPVNVVTYHKCINGKKLQYIVWFVTDIHWYQLDINQTSMSCVSISIRYQTAICVRIDINVHIRNCRRKIYQISWLYRQPGYYIYGVF